MLGWLLCAAVAAAAGDDGGPSVLVLPVRLQGDIPAAAQPLVTGALTSAVRAQKRFARVVTSDEIQKVLDLERQRQLLDCSDASCLAELAGALGAQYTLTVTVGQLGKSWLVNAVLGDARSAVVKSSASRTVHGKDLTHVVEALDPLLTVLLDDAELPYLERTMAVAEAAPRSQRALQPRRQVRERVDLDGDPDPTAPGPSGLRPWHAAGLGTLACAAPLPLCALGAAGSLAYVLAEEPLRIAYFNGPGKQDPLNPVNTALLVFWPVAMLTTLLFGLPIPLALGSSAGGGVLTMVLVALDRTLWNLTAGVEQETQPKRYRHRKCRGAECDDEN